VHGNLSSKNMATKAKSKSAKKTAKTAQPKKKPAKKPAKWVYTFGDGKAEGRAGMRNLLGGKGAGLAEMANLGLPVPPGFTITTEVCTATATIRCWCRCARVDAPRCRA
jgi:pyruvate, orthophosphate dikinase